MNGDNVGLVEVGPNVGDSVLGSLTGFLDGGFVGVTGDSVGSNDGIFVGVFVGKGFVVGNDVGTLLVGSGVLGGLEGEWVL